MNKKEDQKETGKMKRKLLGIIGISCVIVLVVGALIWWMVGKNSNPQKQKAFQIGEETVTMEEVNICVLQNMLPIGFDEKTLGETLESGTPAEEYYKNSIYTSIKYYKLECQIAKKQQIELSEEEMQAVNDDVSAFLSSVNGKWLRKCSISKETIKKVLSEQHLAHKVETQAVGDVEVEEQHFCTMYIMLFPKIETTENGEFVMEDDGTTPVLLEESEIAKQKQHANKAREEMLQSDDLDGIAKKYQVEAFSGEQSNMQESFEEAFVESAKTLKEGECSEIIDISSCYAVLKMISEQDEEKEEEILGNHKKQLENEKLIEKRTEWEKEILVDASKEKTFRSWNNMSLYDYITKK